MFFVTLLHAEECTLDSLIDTCTTFKIKTVDPEISLSPTRTTGFNRIISIKSIIFDAESALETLEDGSLNSYPSVTSIMFEEGCKISSLGDNFNAFPSLKSIDFSLLNIASVNSGFHNCHSLTQITLGSSITDFFPTAFTACPYVSKVILAEGSSLHLINSAVYSSDKARLLYYPPFCEGPITLPIEFQKFEYTIPEYACITEIDASFLTDIPNNFICLNKLKKVNLQNATTIGDYAFSNCRNLETVTFSELLESIGAHAFEKTGLIKLSLPNSVTTINESAFTGCVFLTEVKTPVLAPSVFSGCLALENVEISSQISKIPDMSFEKCHSLCSFRLPDSITVIGQRAFANSSLSNQFIVTEQSNLDEIQSDAFLGTLLKSFKISQKLMPDKVYTDFYSHVSEQFIVLNSDHFRVAYRDLYTTNGTLLAVRADSKTYSVPTDTKVIFKNCFKNCENILSVCLGNTVTDIRENAFCGLCLFEILLPDTLQKIDPSAFNGAMISRVLFKGTCPNLKEFSLIDASGIISISVPEGVETIPAIQNNPSLLSITLPDTLREIKLFIDCPKLESIALPPNLVALPDIPFYNCNHLSSITSKSSSFFIENGCLIAKSGKLLYCPSLFFAEEISTGEANSISAYAFTNMHFLKKLTITSTVTSIDSSAVYNCSLLEKIELSPNIESLDEATFCECQKLSLFLIDKNSKLKSMSSNTFYNCPAISSFFIPANLTIDVRSLLGSFLHLESVEVSKDNVLYQVKSDILYSEGRIVLCPPLLNDAELDVVDEMDDLAFSNSLYLTKVTIDGPSVISNGCFMSSQSLTEVFIGKSVKQIKSNAFYGCSRLTKVTIEAEIEELPSQVFFGCSSLKEITLPETVAIIGTSAMEGIGIEIMPTLPEKVTILPFRMFENCKLLKEAVIPKSVTTIQDALFLNCELLEKVTFESDQITVIPSEMFSGCKNLKEISLPDSIISIGKSAFDKSGIASITLPANLTTIMTPFCKETFSLSQIVSLSDRFDVLEGGILVDVANNNIIKVLTAETVTVTGTIDNSSLIWNDHVLTVDMIKSEMTEIPILPSQVETLILPPTITMVRPIKNILLASDTFSIVDGSIVDVDNNEIINTIQEEVTCYFAKSIKKSTIATKVSLFSLKTIGIRAFQNSKISTIDAPNVETITKYAFENCTQLSSVTFQPYTYYGYMAFSGSGLTSVSLNFDMDDGVFMNCQNLQNFDGKSAQSLPAKTFKDCKSLATFKNLPTVIYRHAFKNCESISEIEISDRLSIDRSAFQGCVGIKSVKLHKSSVSSSLLFDNCVTFSLIDSDDMWFEKDGIIYHDNVLFAFPPQKSEKIIIIDDNVKSVKTISQNAKEIYLTNESSLVTFEAPISQINVMSIGRLTETISISLDSQVEELIVWGLQNDQVLDQFKRMRSLKTIRAVRGLSIDISQFISDVTYIEFDPSFPTETPTEEPTSGEVEPDRSLTKGEIIAISCSVGAVVLIAVTGIAIYFVVKRRSSKLVLDASLYDNIVKE